MSASCRAMRGLDTIGMVGRGGGERPRRAVSPRCRRDRRERPRPGLRRLCRHAWRCRRAPRRRDPAGCGLHREVRDLCQHRGEGADGVDAPPSRPARRAKTGRSCGRFPSALGARLALRYALRVARQSSTPPTRISLRIGQIAPGEPMPSRRWRRRPEAAKGRSAIAGQRFLPDQPDRPRLGDHGRVLVAGRGAGWRARRSETMNVFVARLSRLPGCSCSSREPPADRGAADLLAYILYADRKIWAAVQMRRGPNVVGPFGLLQPFADLLQIRGQGSRSSRPASTRSSSCSRR